MCDTTHSHLVSDRSSKDLDTRENNLPKKKPHSPGSWPIQQGPWVSHLRERMEKRKRKERRGGRGGGERRGVRERWGRYQDQRMSHAMLHVWMNYVTHVNESWHTHKWVMAHTYMSCYTFEWIMSHMWMSHGTPMNESWHTHTCHVTHVNELCHTDVMLHMN